jgi:hypothetical protein
VAAVQPLREKLDACLIFPSMPAVMKLNKLGTFSMAQLGQSKSIIGDFIKSARKVRSARDGPAPTNCGWVVWGTAAVCSWRGAAGGDGRLVLIWAARKEDF